MSHYGHKTAALELWGPVKHLSRSPFPSNKKPFREWYLNWQSQWSPPPAYVNEYVPRRDGEGNVHFRQLHCEADTPHSPAPYPPIVMTRQGIILNRLTSHWLGTPTAWNAIALGVKGDKNVSPAPLIPYSVAIFLPQKYLAVSSSKATLDSHSSLLSEWKMVLCKRSRGCDANSQGALSQAFDRELWSCC